MLNIDLFSIICYWCNSFLLNVPSSSVLSQWKWLGLGGSKTSLNFDGLFFSLKKKEHLIRSLWDRWNMSSAKYIVFLERIQQYLSFILIFIKTYTARILHRAFTYHSTWPWFFKRSFRYTFIIITLGEGHLLPFLKAQYLLQPGNELTA